MTSNLPDALGAVIKATDASGRPDTRWVHTGDGWWHSETEGVSCTVAALTDVVVLSEGMRDREALEKIARYLDMPLTDYSHHGVCQVVRLLARDAGMKETQ